MNPTPTTPYAGSSLPLVGGVNHANALVSLLNFDLIDAELYRANYTPEGVLDISIPNNGNVDPDPKRQWVPPPTDPNGPLNFGVTGPVCIYVTTTANGGWINAAYIEQNYISTDGTSTVDVAGLSAFLLSVFPPK